ncbi:secreted RxLR effector protein 161-like [Phaseolus vulgaris]|uniref:secreted RxLR effector protein 161-like n=1 Tax=Phaseolus vulgaris TaxID=3885 RepID=UPI0035CA9693
MESCKEASTPMPSNCYMDANAVGKGVDQTKYRGLIGSLLYLTISRPNIMFAVCLCARYQANPKESHFKAAKRILKYLKGTTNVGLWYPSHSPIHLTGYSDYDFAGCKLDRKSTSGTCHLLGSSLISWHSKKQACVAFSIAEAEYIAVGSCCAQILWLKQQLADFGLQISKIQHSRTKHIEIRHHFIRDHVSSGDCEVKFIETKLQLADIFTKPLPKERFFFLRNELGILDLQNLS